MEKVTGIGGFFFRSENPKELSAWYQQHLGITLAPESFDSQPWAQQAGPTVFAPFDMETEYFGKPEKMWMLNFRVRNLDAMVKQLQEAGIDIEVSAENYPNGRFARLYDPEGNPVELWQPED